MFGVFQQLLMSPSFWLITIIVVVLCLIPDYLLLTYDTYRPIKVLRKNEEPPQPLNCSDDDSEHSSQMVIKIKIFNKIKFSFLFSNFCLHIKTYKLYLFFVI